MNHIKIPAPVGLMPRLRHDRQRALEIVAAVDRYVRASKHVPKEWFDELICATKD